MHHSTGKGKTRNVKLGAFTIDRFIAGLDIYGLNLPTFNLKGRGIVTTLCGGVFSLIIFMIALSYGLLKMIHLLDKANPNVTVVSDKDVYDFNEILNFGEINFRIAWSIEGYHSREMKNDPKYVKYLVRKVGRKNGESFEKIMDYHICTEDDWAEFTPPSKGSADGFEQLKNDPKRGMFCLDDPDEGEEEDTIYGNENNDNFQRTEIVLLPCNYVHSYMGYKGDTIHPECIGDL